MKPNLLLSERGLTLTELTIVGAIASLVMLGLVGFYVSSQGLWMDASTQAISQREASSLVESINGRIRSAHHAVVTPSPDALHSQLELYNYGSTLADWVYWWDGNDSLVHEGPSASNDRGPMLTSRVEFFQLAAQDSVVYLQLLQVRSAQGERVQMTSQAACQNR